MFNDQLSLAEYQSRFCWTLVCYFAPSRKDISTKALKDDGQQGITAPGQYGRDYTTLPPEGDLDWF